MTAKYSDSAIAKEMHALRQHYSSNLPIEIETIKTLAAKISPDSIDHDLLRELDSMLHKLTGSGGTFGFIKLSKLAEEAETMVKGWLDCKANQILPEELVLFKARISMFENNIVDHSDDTITIASQKNLDLNNPISLWLIGNDEPLNQELTRQLLSFCFLVRTYSSLSEAELDAQTEAPDLLVLDINPYEDDDNYLNQLSHHPHVSRLNCPIILLSSVDDFSSRVHAAQINVEGFFLKPLNIPKLVNRLVQIHERRQAAPPKVLIIDDDPLLAKHYCLTLLKAGMEVAILKEPEKIIEEISAFRPELVLMDLHMPKYSGRDLAGVIRQHENWSGLPVVFLSAEKDVKVQVNAMNSGADDFLTKPISDSQLISAVQVRVERARQLAAQLNMDSLTGLLKHANIKEMAEAEVSRSQRNATPVTIVMLDIDNFKSVNDVHGHAKGDLVISSISMLLRQRLRQSDIIGRYGGEEFVVVLPNCNADAAFFLIEDIRQRFAKIVFKDEHKDFSCTVSAGVASSIDHTTPSATELFLAADTALYAAKNAGRNKVKKAKITKSAKK